MMDSGVFFEICYLLQINQLVSSMLVIDH